MFDDGDGDNDDDDAVVVVAFVRFFVALAANVVVVGLPLVLLVK